MVLVSIKVINNEIRLYSFNMGRKFLLPGHNYIGPGNKARVHGNEAVPIDKDDEIAAEHDDNYAIAKTKEDIYNADYKAVRDFGSDFLKTGNYHSAIGAVGLGLKTSVERLTNRVYYPNLGKSWLLLYQSGKFLLLCRTVILYPLSSVLLRKNMNEEEETAEHIIFTCPQFAEARQEMWSISGTDTSPDNLVRRLCSSSDIWQRH